MWRKKIRKFVYACTAAALLTGTLLQEVSAAGKAQALLKNMEDSISPFVELSDPVDYKKAKAPKASIKLNRSSATLYTAGTKTIQLKATVTGPSKKVTWKSSNKKIAAVNPKGKVTAKKAGTVTITAKANGVSAKCKVTVRKKTATAKLYKSFLQKQYTYINSTILYGKPSTRLNLEYFCVVDINQDGTDELLIRASNHIGSHRYIGDALHVFTVKNGKVQYAGSWIHGTTEVNTRYGGIRVRHSGTDYGGDSIISLRNGKCYQKIYLYGHGSYHDRLKWQYFLNNEHNEITEQKYKEYHKRYFENKKDIQVIHYLKNNVINRGNIK